MLGLTLSFSSDIEIFYTNIIVINSLMIRVVHLRLIVLKEGNDGMVSDDDMRKER